MRKAGFLLLAISSSALALPPNSPYREGANHMVGDDSFFAKHGRTPDTRDSEKARMRVHLEDIRAVLAARPATRPELAKRRAELLGYLDDYIAKGITPVNWNLPWRTPVFIDDDGAICAVGYLIERSVGRALPERIAATHKFDYLQDIAKAMPEVATWIVESGFTLDELASIQPGYTEPEANTWQRWFTGNIPDGKYDTESARETASHGRFKNRKMQGKWVTYASKQEQFSVHKEALREPEKDRRVVGQGDLKNGAGKWTSLYPDGKLLAEGWYSNNHPNGTWRFFHKSGNVAATGEFTNGTRTGRWQFFHDSDKRTPIAIGSFNSKGHVTGRWEHFGADGKLIASSRQETPSQWRLHPSGPNNGEGELIHVVPGADGIKHSISVGTIDQSVYRLDTFARGADRIYVYEADTLFKGDLIVDANGHRLDKADEAWTSRDCKWSTKRREIAKSGDVARMHGLLFHQVRNTAGWHNHEKEPLECGEAKRVDAARGKRIDALLASRTLVRAQSPQFVRDLVLNKHRLDRGETDVDPGEATQDDVETRDLIEVITKHMSWYVEWPHIDGRFIAVFRTLPGHHVRHWWDQMDGMGG